MLQSTVWYWMAQHSEYEWTMMRFKTSLSLSLKEIKIIEISHKKLAGQTALNRSGGRCKKISCIFVVAGG